MNTFFIIVGVMMMLYGFWLVLNPSKQFGVGCVKIPLKPKGTPKMFRMTYCAYFRSLM